MNEWIDNLLHVDELIQLFRILIGIILGACIGFEREKYGRPAGLRTHMIVCAASTLAMLVSIFGFSSGDPARLAAQVISGIGFIGAGTIIRGDKDITGITTAATIWICAIIGLACGAGYYFGAILTTILSLVILSCVSRFESKLSKSRKYSSSLNILVKYEDTTIERLKEVLNRNSIALTSIEYKLLVQDDEKLYKINVAFGKHTKVTDLNGFLADIDKEFKPMQCKISNESFVNKRYIRERDK